MSYTRRAMLGTSAAVIGAASLARGQSSKESVSSDFRVANGRIRQSVMGWCFRPMSSVELAKHCREIGLVAIEGIPPEDYPAVRRLGLAISLVSSHSFKTGPCNPENRG